jgi:putative transposase
VDHYQVIVCEELAPLEMGRSRGMRKSVVDVARSQFVEITRRWPTLRRRVVLVNHKQTTKICSSYGEMLPKALSVRVHTCPARELVLERDHRAALNTLHRGLQTLRLSHNECGTAHSEAQVLEPWELSR